MDWLVAGIILGIGGILLFTSSLYLFKYFNEIAKKQNTTISMYALRHASFVGISSIIIIIIGILYMMNIIPIK